MLSLYCNQKDVILLWTKLFCLSVPLFLVLPLASFGFMVTSNMETTCSARLKFLCWVVLGRSALSSSISLFLCLTRKLYYIMLMVMIMSVFFGFFVGLFLISISVLPKETLLKKDFWMDVLSRVGIIAGPLIIFTCLVVLLLSK